MDMFPRLNVTCGEANDVTVTQHASGLGDVTYRHFMARWYCIVGEYLGFADLHLLPGGKRHASDGDVIARIQQDDRICRCSSACDFVQHERSIPLYVLRVAEQGPCLYSTRTAKPSSSMQLLT